MKVGCWRQQQVLQMLADGKTRKEISEELNIAPSTVRNLLMLSARRHDTHGIDRNTLARTLVEAMRAGEVR